MIILKTLQEEDKKKQILEGIEKNYSYKQIAKTLRMSPRRLRTEIKIMRRNKDPIFLKAQNDRNELKIKAKNKARERREKTFYDMTGMTFTEKSFQNMIDFYRPELNKIMISIDPLAAINKLPVSIRKTLTKNNILIRNGHLEISQKAREQL